MDARTNIKGRLPSRHLTEGCARASAVRAVLTPRLDRCCAAPPASANEVAEIFKKTPCVADLKPPGRFVAKDMDEIDGIPLLMKTLLDNGHLDGDCITVTGRTIAENLKSVKWHPHPAASIGEFGRAAVEVAM